MISSTSVVLSLLLVSVLVAGQADKAPPLSSNKDDKSHEPHKPSATMVEIHHSLHTPLDQSQVYWNFGGSTVLTRHAIRLTPANQNRRGWIWNDYPIESQNWEVEFHIEVASKPHFGGDGFGFWLLDSLQDPTYHSDPSFLNGDVFGLKKDFKGMGVVFDIYDNDGRRDNPSVFVLYNPEGVSTQYNHDNDYQDDMYKVVAPGQNPAYTCTAQVRNLKHPVKVMVKFIRQVLHVYLDTEDGLGYKFCLAVQFDKPNPFKDHHIAFTAHTGQVADLHDITQLTTRYLSESETTDDDHMLHMEQHPHCSTRAFFYWVLVVMGSFGLIATFVHLLVTFRQLEAADINPVLVCEKMNKPMVPHLGVYFGICFLLAIGLQWEMLIVNAPLLLWRIYQIVRNQHLLNPAALGGEKVHGQKGLSFSTKLIFGIVVYSITFLFSFYRWYSC